MATSTTKKRTRSRTQSKEVQINKKYKECKEDIFENSEESCDSDSFSGFSGTEESPVTMDTNVQSKSVKDKDKVDLNILREPSAMDELIQIFKPLIQSVKEEMTNRIDNLEKKFDEEMDNTKEDIAEIKTRLNKIDRVEQQQRINNLMFCGLKEKDNENTTEEIINFVKEKLPNVELKLENIDKCFCLKVKSNPEKPTNLPRPILVKFSSYNTRSAIYKAKKQLKESDGRYFINEDLIPKISSLFAKTCELRSEGYIEKAWTHDSVILYTLDENDSNPKTIASETDIDEIRRTRKPRDNNTPNKTSEPSTSKG